MSELLEPAIAVANKMSFNFKLILAVLIFLVPFIVVLFITILESWNDIRKIEKQQDGLVLVVELKPIALEIAKHRGNMAQYLSGAKDKESIILAVENSVDVKIEKLKKLAAQNSYEIININDVVSNWQQLKLVNTKVVSAPINFQAHSALVTKIHRTMSKVTADFDLIAQNSNTDHYLESIMAYSIPRLEEEFGQLRGRGAGALADKMIDESEKITLGSLLSAAQNLNNTLDQDLELLFKESSIRERLNANAQNFRTAIQQFIEITHNQVELVNSNSSVSANTYFETGTKAIEALHTFDQQITSEFNNSIQLRHDKQYARNLLLMSVAFLITSVGIYFALGILTSLNNNAKLLSDASHKLKDGDFSTQIIINSEDTLGDAAKSLTGMVGSVAQLLNSIQKSAHDVNELSVKLQSVSDASKLELDQQNLQTQQAASAATEMAATIREVARSCVDVSSATDTAHDSALDGQLKVNNAIAKINTLGGDVEQARHIISQVQNDVADISAVLEVIRSIAEQTNLLALNAAIEAARAGEQGRGFAVVADEVRSLAKRTQDSTQEIRSVIEKLQTGADRAVNIIHQSFLGAQDSVTSAASAGQSLEKIVVGVELLRDLNTQIATAAEQQAAVAEQMSRNTRHLSDSSENILNQVEKTVSFSGSLRKSAMSLLENTMKFKT